MKEIRVVIKEKYGQERIYPVCHDGKAFAKLLSQETLTRRDIDIIKNELGYSVKVEQPVTTL